MALAEASKSMVKRVTAEELWELAQEGQAYELIKGELINVSPPGGEHGDITSEIILLLRGYAKKKNLGKVLTESGFRIAAEPDTVRSPDVSFLAQDKIPAGGLAKGFISGSPDLAVEVVSPNDTASQIQDKVQDYLAHGTRLVWVVYPQQRIVIVHYPDGTAKTLHEADSLSGENVLPGFSCQVKEIFS
jgi:Uma2 family endonuclease